MHARAAAARVDAAASHGGTGFCVKYTECMRYMDSCQSVSSSRYGIPLQANYVGSLHTKASFLLASNWLEKKNRLWNFVTILCNILLQSISLNLNNLE